MDEGREVSREEAKGHVGPGWHLLIDILYAALPPGVRVVQVKEKFGLLRVYADGPEWEEAHKVINALETLAGHLCEWCGKRGTQNESGTGWILTLCEDHRKEREAKHGRG